MADNVSSGVLYPPAIVWVACSWCSSTLVLRLLSRCGPSTIVRFVVAVIVDSVQAVRGRWARSHVGKEINERRPTIAHADSSSTIVRVSWMSRCASRVHVYPRQILISVWRQFRKSRLASRCSMCCRAEGSPLFLQASATLMFSAAKVVSMRDRLLAAITATQPSALNAFVRAQTQNCQPSKSVANKIQRFAHYLIVTPNLSEVIS